MTAVEDRPTQAPARPMVVETVPSRTGWLAPAGAAISLVAVLVLGFGGYLFAFSTIQEARSQSNEYKSFRKALGEATAPVGPVRIGAPVAIIDIPAIGLHHAVVNEGTSAGVLTRGPGHRVNSPLPGQAGIAALFGRRSTFGAPFAHLPRLRFGDRIEVTTGLGTATYLVRDAGDASHPLTDTAANQLLLVTADGTLRPHHTLTISAELQGDPFPGSTPISVLPAADRALAGDPGTLLPLMLWSLVLVVIATAWTVGRQYWYRPAGYLIAVPVLAAVTWNVYENAAQLLPNAL